MNTLCLCVRASAKARLRRARGEGIVELFALEQGLSLPGAPRNRCNAAECDAGVAHDPVLQVESDSRRDKREFVGLAVAHFQIDRLWPAAGDGKGRDQFAGE